MLSWVSTLCSFVLFAQAKQVVITVGGDIVAGNLTTTFSPQLASADVGDVIFFNFTNGTHSATQCNFATPCLPIHDTNSSVNGFDTSLRPAGNGSAITNFQFTVTDLNPIYYYDSAPEACGNGAVGVINSNESSTVTLAGFIRNAERLNGTAATSTSSSSATSSAPASQSSTAGNSSNTSGALALRPGQPTYVLGLLSTVIMLFAGAILVF